MLAPSDGVDMGSKTDKAVDNINIETEYRYLG